MSWHGIAILLTHWPLENLNEILYMIKSRPVHLLHPPLLSQVKLFHYSDMLSEITRNLPVASIASSGLQQRKYKSSALLALCEGNPRGCYSLFPFIESLLINSLWSSHVMWRQGSRSTLTNIISKRAFLKKNQCIWFKFHWKLFISTGSSWQYSISGWSTAWHRIHNKPVYVHLQFTVTYMRI